MECPKCQGGAYLAEEELVKVLENTRPTKAILKATFVCRSCTERFSRLVTDTLDNRKLEIKNLPPQPYYRREEGKSEEEAAEGLKFF
jgi:Zn-finger nucleic acid-binding protein